MVTFKKQTYVSHESIQPFQICINQSVNIKEILYLTSQIHVFFKDRCRWNRGGMAQHQQWNSHHFLTVGCQNIQRYAFTCKCLAELFDNAAKYYGFKEASPCDTYMEDLEEKSLYKMHNIKTS